MINETKYPTLSWSSFRPRFLPENLQMKAVDVATVSYMKVSKSFNSMIALLGFDYYEGNSLAQRMKKVEAIESYVPHKNVYLSEKAFHRVEHDHNFRMKVWNSQYVVPSSSGSILFKNEGCYMYRILSPEDSKVYLQAQMTDVKIDEGSRYFSIAFFIGDAFLSFEEGFITNEGAVSVAEGGYYPNGNEIGQYISFCLITLKAFWGNFFNARSLPPQSGLNQSNQKVTYLEL